MFFLPLLLAHAFISQVSAVVTVVRSVRIIPGRFRGADQLLNVINSNIHHFAGSSETKANPPPQTPLLDELVQFPRGGWVPGQNINSYIDKLFDSVDEDHDGGVSIEELYERVLLLYVKINQQASVPPPTKATVVALFRNADTDRSQRLDREQFSKIMKVIYSRAATRMVLAKLSKVVVAPLLALNTVQWASCSGCWWREKIVSKVPEQMSFLLNANLWRSLLTVLFIITLTNAVVSAATVLLDGICGVDNKKDEVDVGI